MDQQPQQPGQNGPQGPAGRRLHIAHRRSPSEMTPLMSESPEVAVLCLPAARRTPPWSMLTPLDSGTASSCPADRDAAATATADRCYPPTVRQHGHDPTATTTPQPVPATAGADAEPQCITTTRRLPIPTRSADGPATFRPANGPSLRTSSQSVCDA